jgi:hypothetical protein
VIVGTDGAILLPHVAAPVVFPTAKFADRPLPVVTARNHYHEFLDAVAAGPGTRCSANFDYASLLTEVVLLGTLACRHPSESLTYDASGLRFEGRRDHGHGFARNYRRKYLTP